jgi:hypothetical protein
LELLGKYNINGRILLLPISGDGDANVTLGKNFFSSSEAGR